MRSALAVACLLLCAPVLAVADSIDVSIHQLGDKSSYKVRLAATLALSKSRDPRAVLALATTLTRDSDSTIRRISALALERMISSRTAADARVLAFEALDQAVAVDKNSDVRETAARTLKALANLRPKRGPHLPKPSVFVNVDATTDQSKRLTRDSSERVMRIVKRSVERTGYATSWPGGLPTSAELLSNRSRAFIVASTVKKVEITRAGLKTQVACTVAIRIAPWSGKDGGERWEANRAASASGSAKAMTGNHEREIQGGVRDCIEAVAEDVTSRQVVPFLRRLAGS
ncbi:MAG: HEAT repeat domain-containing protein [Kofleriaceae bacterium]